MAVSDGRGSQLDPRIVQHRFRRCDAEYFAVPAGGGAANRHGEDGGPFRSSLLGGVAGVTAVGNKHDAGDGSSLETVAHGSQGARQVAPASTRAQGARVRRRQTVAIREELGLEPGPQRGEQFARHQGTRAIDAPLAAHILNAHAPRGVDENRHDRVTRVSLGRAGDRTHEKHDEQQERGESQRNEGQPRRRA